MSNEFLGHMSREIGERDLARILNKEQPGHCERGVCKKSVFIPKKGRRGENRKVRDVKKRSSKEREKRFSNQDQWKIIQNRKDSLAQRGEEEDRVEKKSQGWQGVET